MTSVVVVVVERGHLLEKVLALGGSWLPQLGVRQHPARHVGRSPWLRRHRGILGSQRRRRRRPAARPGIPRRITPGPAQRATTRRRGSSREGRGWFGWWPERLRVAGRPGPVGSDRDPPPFPAPAQSQPRPNPIVPPGLGLAYVLARTKWDAGRAAPAASGDPATARPPRRPPPAPHPPWSTGPRDPGAFPAGTAEGRLQP